MYYSIQEFMLVKIVDQASHANYQLETFVKEKIDLVLRVSDWYNAVVKQLANDSIFIDIWMNYQPWQDRYGYKRCN